MGAKLLVVDDENTTRRIVVHTLKSLNIEVLGAQDGSQALKLARENELMLAIVDINLPDIDGFEVIRQMKQLPHLRDVPVIIFTARSHAGDQHIALEVGAAGFFYKPFSTQELRDLVTRYLA